MKQIIFILCMFCWIAGKSQQYTVSADTTTCRMTVTNPGAEIKYMFLVDEVRYIDQTGGNEIQIFDDRMTFRAFNTQIVSHASFAALKTDIDTWIAACR